MDDVQGLVAFVRAGSVTNELSYDITPPSRAGTSTPASRRTVTSRRTLGRARLNPFSTKPVAVNTPYPSEQAAAAAIMAPVFDDSLDFAKESRDGSCSISFRKAVITSIVLFVLVPSGLMYSSMMKTAADIRGEGITACDEMGLAQNEMVAQLIDDNVTAASFQELLRSINLTVAEFVKIPADSAVEALWGSMRANQKMRPGWKGTAPDERKWLTYRSWVELAKQWGVDQQWQVGATGRQMATNALTATFVTGQCAGAIISPISLDCPSAGPELCGSCVTFLGQKPCEILSAVSFDADVGAGGNTIRSLYQLNLTTGEAMPFRLWPPSNYSFATERSFVIQAHLAAEAKLSAKGAGSVPAQRLWSAVSDAGAGLVKMTWTSPIAYCGDYSCFEGVIASDVMLKQVSTYCRNEWQKMVSLLASPAYDFAIGESNSTVFIVSHVAHHFSDQQGLLIGVSQAQSERGDDENRVQEFANSTNRSIINDTAWALLRRFGAWNATELQEREQLFNFTQAGGHGPCASDLLGEARASCRQVATLSVKLDEYTKWLIVAVLPAGAFNAQPKVLKRRVNIQVKDAEKKADGVMDQARNYALGIFVVIAWISSCIGLGLGCLVSQPLHRLSDLMRDIGNLDFARESTGLDQLRSGQRARIKDISELQNAFCRLLVGIEAFARFVPESVVTRIVRGNRRATRLHVDKCEVTIMFSSISGFANITSTLTEEQVLRILRQYHTVMTSVVEKHKGAVAEILDDGLLVYWNVPELVKSHAVKACQAALAKVRHMESINAELVREGLPALTLHIGIHTGAVLSGNIGSDMKMKFGCMGDSVNLGSRLNGLCKQFGVNIICSRETHDALGNVGFLCRELALVKVKGRREATTIFEVIGRDHNRVTAVRSEAEGTTVTAGQRMTRVSFGTEASCESSVTGTSRSSAIFRLMSWSGLRQSGRAESPVRWPTARMAIGSPAATVSTPAGTALPLAPSVRSGGASVTSRVLSEDGEEDLEEGPSVVATPGAPATEEELGTLARDDSSSVSRSAKRLPSGALGKLWLPGLAGVASPVQLPWRPGGGSGRNTPGLPVAAGPMTIAATVVGRQGELPVLLGASTPTAALDDDDDSEELVTEEQREGARLYEEVLRAFRTKHFTEAKGMATLLVESRPEDKASRRLLDQVSKYVGPDGTETVVEADWKFVDDIVHK